MNDPASTPATRARLARLGRRLSFAPLLCAAALALAVPACGDDSRSGNDDNNNAGNNNTGNNNPNNTANNDPNNNPNNTTGNNNPNNNPDPVAACREACTTLGTTCRDEFLVECPMQVVDGLIPACQEGCNDPDARAQIEAVAGLPCATVVPLAISGFGLTDLCADEPDLCEGVTCDAGSTCNPADGMCEPDTIDLCEGVTCDAGETCDPADGTCVEPPPCGDTYEPNNTAADATALTAEDQTIEGLSICLADHDFYTFTLPAGQSAHLTFSFSHAIHDIDVRVTAERNGNSSTFISESSFDAEYISIPAGEGEATVVVEVFVFEEAGENSYSLQLDIDPERGGCNVPADCGPEDFCSGRKLCLPRDTCIIDDDCHSRGGLLACVDDVCVECSTNAHCFSNLCNPDNTCVECTADDQCLTNLCRADSTCAECTHSDQCADVEFCSPEGNCIECTSDLDCVGGEVCNLTNNTCALSGCDGPPDNNDTFQTAATIQAGTFDAVICGGEQDWYAITVAEGDNLYVRASFSHALGDLDLALYGSNGTDLVDDSDSVRDDEYIVGLNLTAGIYYLQVRGFAEASNTYTVNAQINPALPLCKTTGTCAAGTTCTERRLCVDNGTCEDNHDCPFISNSSCDLVTNTCVQCLSDDQCDSQLCNPDHTCAECTSDDNCFDSEVCSAENRCVECTSDDPCTDGEVCNTDTGSCVACNIDADCLGSGFTCVQNACTPGPSCDGTPDNNDTRNAAQPLTAGTYDFIICDGESDWYSLTVAEGDNLYITLSFIDSLGDLDTTLYRGAETGIFDSSVSTYDNEYLVGLNLTAGTYVWEVRGYQSASNTYRMTVEINPGLDLCTMDAQCGADASCTNRQRCVPLGTCENQHDCSSQAQCFEGRCVECNTDNDCSNGSVCSPTSTCVECVEDSQCNGNDLCDLNTNVCVCGPDAAGENHSFNSAFALTSPTSLDGLSTCDGESYFSVNLTAGQSFTATISFVNADGDLDLFLLNSSMNVVDSSNGLTDVETLTYTAPTSGVYYLVVAGFESAVNDFDLDVSVQ